MFASAPTQSQQTTFRTLRLMNDASGPVGSRVLVVGMAGSGKSTFSRTRSAKDWLASDRPRLPLLEAGWFQPSDDERREKQRRLLSGDFLDRRRQRPPDTRPSARTRRHHRRRYRS